MPINYSPFGIASDDRKAIGDRVGELLNVKIEVRNSDVWDLLYFFQEESIDDFHIKIYSDVNKCRLDPGDEGYPYLESYHADLETFLEIDNVEDLSALDRILLSDPILKPRLIERDQD